MTSRKKHLYLKCNVDSRVGDFMNRGSEKEIIAAFFHHENNTTIDKKDPNINT